MLQALDGPETNCYCQCERKAVRSLVLNCAPTTTTTPSLDQARVLEWGVIAFSRATVYRAAKESNTT